MYLSRPKSRAAAVLMILFLLVGQLGSSSAPALAADSAANSDIITGAFKDVPETSPNFLFINYLSKRGLLKGFPDGTFQPAAGLTRAEAAAVLVKAAGLKTQPAKAVFKDVGPRHWAAASIAAAKDAGLLAGYPDGTFRPEARLTRAEGITLILKLSRQPDPGVELPVLADMNYGHWAARSVAIGLASDMIGLASDNSGFLPDAVMTRGSLSRALAMLLIKDPDLYKTSLTDRLKVVSGSVSVIRAGSAATETITGSTELKPGDTVRIGTAGTADISFPDGTSLRLEQGSRLTVREAIGRSYIKTDGTPGTAVESLIVDLKGGRLFGALATSAETGNETASAAAQSRNQVQAKAMSLGSLPEDRVRTAAAETKPLPWWKQSSIKRTKVKVDMPTGVAAIRGTFWQNIVNPDGSFDTTLLTGSAEVTAAGRTVDLTAGQRTKVAGTGAPPAPPAPLTTEDKKEWVKQKDWALNTAREIAAQQPVAVPAPPPADKPEQPAPPAQSQQPQQPQTPLTDKAGSPADVISTVENAVSSAENAVPADSSLPSPTGSDDSGSSDNTIFVSGIELDTQYVSLEANGPTHTVTAHVYPAGATNPAVTWTSSNPSVAAVQNGVITPFSAGFATITAAAVENNTISASCEVQVTVTSPDTGGAGSGGGGSTSAQSTIRVSSMELASVSNDGLQANDSSGGGEYPSSVSRDGRYVAFYSYAKNLVANDTNNATDIFVRDRKAGTTVRVSVDSNGYQGSSGSRAPKISADGRYVAFTSGAANLVSGDTNGREDVFVHDRDADNDGIYDETNETGAISTVRVSVATDGTQANNYSSSPSISADGRYVTFYSSATNLAADDTNGLSDVFVRDLKTGSTQRVSVSTDGTQANAECYFPTISPDGRFVAYTSGATTLVPGLNTFGIFVRDLVYNTTSFLVEGSDPDLSYNGRFMAYSSGNDIFIRDRDPNSTGVFDQIYADSRATVGLNGLPANGSSYKPSISWDGRFAAFTSNASNLVSDDNNNDGDIFVWDNLNKLTKRVSAPRFGGEADYGSWYQAMSGDGRCIAFTSGASNLVAGDTNDWDDVFLAALTPDSPPDTLAPDAPAVHAAVYGPSWVQLVWTPVIDNTSVVLYTIYRGNNSSGPFSKIGSVYGSVYSFWDTSVMSAASYYYYVQAQDEDGNQSPASGTIPVNTTNIPQVQPSSVPIAAGYDYSLASLADGSAWAWGDNYNGSLGIGTASMTITPQAVVYSGVYFTDISSMDAYYHTLAVRSDGTVWAWGANEEGQLGRSPDYSDHTTPVQVAGLRNIQAVAAGEYHSLALGSDGTVWSWGGNYDGQLGNRFDINTGAAPMRVVSPDGDGYLTDVIAIAAGYSTSVALKADGSVWTWGYNYWGDLGIGGSPYDNTPHPIPVQVSGLTDIVAVSGGYDHFAALKRDGTVWTWGYNGSGELGDGTATLRTSPVQVVDPGDSSGHLTGVKAIAAGQYHSLALKINGSVWGWGNNSYYQLGDGTWSNRKQPIQVLGPGGTGNLSGITAIAADAQHSLAFSNDGTVWAWGYNYSGQLGDGTRTDRSSPVQVIFPALLQ